MALTVPLDRITAEARHVRFGRTMLTVLAGVLFGLGWCVAKIFSGAWFAMAWTATAVKVGWVEARKDLRR
ncbi:hypothetical protein ACFWYW_55780 [Nonomuraea sp. NPDC059023]|uniref:hypothetical protein n=1 Tax=unclassified Nonomuraea TaxID=2593643 RepID=UPI0036B1DB68